MHKYIGLILISFFTGCSRQEPVAPATQKEAPAIQTARPAPQPSLKESPPAITNLSEAQPAGQGIGGAVVDVITERNKIEAGRKAKATVDAAAAKENKDIDAVINE
jgi:hypothetical protein